MKKRLILLALLLLGMRTACAGEETALPQSVADLCAQIHPGYEIMVYDGWGNEDCGQFALILSRDGDNILCMTERAQDEPAYRMTIDNTNAVYDGDVLPSLLIDTGGDALFYGYYDESVDASEQYHTDKNSGSWSSMDVMAYRLDWDGHCTVCSFVTDGMLRYQHDDEDENGNILSSWDYAPIAVDDAFEMSMLPQHFNINTYTADPSYGLNRLIRHEAFACSQAEDNGTLEDMDISRVHAARLFKGTDGRCAVRIDDWDGTFYETAATLLFEGDAVLDAYHAGDGYVYVSSGVMMYSMARVDRSSWVVTGVDDSGVRMIGPDYAAPEGQTIMYRNDGFVYGVSPWGSLRGQDVALASSYEEMAMQLDQEAYALVNNPNPADRLHLRAKPDKGSKSYGKFYNRTPVKVLEHGDTWTRVQIGRGGAAITGYMMTEYLAFDDGEKAALACAFPQKVLRDEHRAHGVPMHAEPRDTAMTARIFKQESSDFIIGVSGGDWYIVLRSDGAVGYVPQRAFWDGNG